MKKTQIPEKLLLLTAENCMKQVIEKHHQTARDYIDMASICQKIALHDKKYSAGNIDMAYLSDALCYIHDALQTVSGCENSFAHMIQGQILSNFNEYQEAMECQKRAIQLENIGTKHVQAFKYLMKTLFRLCREEGQKDDDLKDLVYWTEEGCKRYGRAHLFCACVFFVYIFFYILLHFYQLQYKDENGIPTHLTHMDCNN